MQADIKSGQFFLSEEDCKGESRAMACKHKLQELNRYVKVTVVSNQFASLLDYLNHVKT